MSIHISNDPERAIGIALASFEGTEVKALKTEHEGQFVICATPDRGQDVRYFVFKDEEQIYGFQQRTQPDFERLGFTLGDLHELPSLSRDPEMVLQWTIRDLGAVERSHDKLDIAGQGPQLLAAKEEERRYFVFRDARLRTEFMNGIGVHALSTMGWASMAAELSSKEAGVRGALEGNLPGRRNFKGVVNIADFKRGS